MRSVWSRLGAGSTTVVDPSASMPAISTQDLTWALATGSAVLDARQLGAADRERREAPVARLHAGAHGGERLRHPVHRPAPDRLVAVQRPHPPGLPGEPARQQAHQRAASCPRRAARRWPRAARAAPRRGSARPVAVLVHARPEALDRAQRGRGVGRPPGSCAPPPARRTWRRTARPGARSTCPAAACRCPGAVPRAEARAAGHSSATGKPSSSISSVARAASPSPAIHSVIAPGPHVGGRRERQVHDVHPAFPSASATWRRYRGGSGPSGAARARALR